MPQGKTSPSPRRILLVEDDLDQAHLIKFLLEAQGRYSVTLAQDGLRGTLLVRDTDWDLVITDLNLPGADGMAVVEAARSTQPDTPILATTGYTAPQYAEEALRKGANDVLIKPLERDELLRKVESLLRGDLGPARTDGFAPAGRSTPTTDGHAAPAAPSVAPPAPAPAPVPSPTAPAAPPTATPAPASTAPPPSAPAPSAPAAPAPSAPEIPRQGGQVRVLAVSVRPGDAEAGCGGTLLRHRDRGDRVILLTLSHGRSGPEGAARRDQAKAAGRAMGIRFFVGNAGSGDHPLEEDLERLIRGALTEIRPDLVYVPTVHHETRPLRLIQETVMADAAAAPAVYAYDPGDATHEFRPGAFVPIATTLEEKLRVLATFDDSGGPHLHPDRAATSARFWSRFQGGHVSEALEVVRSEPPKWLKGVSLLPAEEARLE